MVKKKLQRDTLCSPEQTFMSARYWVYVHPDRRIVSQTSPNQKYLSQIDRILMKKKSISYKNDVRTLSVAKTKKNTRKREMRQISDYLHKDGQQGLQSY